MRSARYGAAVAVLLGSAVAWAAPPVELPPEVKGDVGAFVTLRGKTPGDKVVFVPLDSGLNVFPADLLADKKATVVTAAKPGRYRVLAYSAISGDPTDPAVTTVVIGNAPPVPPGPDPGPGPTPDPPKPDGENPFGPQPGLRVMIVYESAEAANLPVGQFLVLQGKKFRDFVDAKCAADGYRFFDKDVKPTVPGQWWAPAMTKGDRKSLPWIYVGKENAGYSGPLPADVDKTIELISKYTGG